MSGNDRRQSLATTKSLQGDKKSKPTPQQESSQNRPQHLQQALASDKSQSTGKGRAMNKTTPSSMKSDDKKIIRRGSVVEIQSIGQPSKSQASFDQDKEEFRCPDCKKVCKDDEAALECEFCERWFHASCQNVTDQLYAAIQADSQAGTNIIHWYCNTSCNFFAKKIVFTQKRH